MDIQLIIDQVDAFTKSHVKEKRYGHSVRVAQVCRELCKIHGLDENTGYLAGIAHDMCKDFSVSQLLELAKQDPSGIPQEELDNPELLHGRSASVLIRQKFDVQDQNVIQAIANHTSACAGLCDLGKILFVADKIEPGRPQSTDAYRANLYSMSLDQMTLAVVQENIEYLEKKGIKPSRFSFELRDELLNKNKD